MRTFPLLVALALVALPPVAMALTEPAFRILRPWLVCNDTVDLCYFIVCHDTRCVHVWVDKSEAYPRVGTCVSVTESPTSIWVGVGDPMAAGDCQYGVRLPPDEVMDLLVP